MSDFELPKTTERKVPKSASLPTDAVSEKQKKIDIESKKDPEYKEDSSDQETLPKYNEEELLKIFDSIIFEGEYSEEVIIRNRLRVTFRTRTAGELDEISQKLDNIKANLIATIAEKRTLLTLIYSLIGYQSKDLRGMKIEDREKFIMNLPGPVIGALLLKLQEFDAKVFEACKVGEENF